MGIKKLSGYVLLAVVFIGVFGLTVYEHGAGAAIISWLSAILLSGLIILAFNLIYD